MTETTDLIALTADIVSTHVGHNSITTAEVPELIRSVHAALAKATNPVVEEAPLVPAVPIRSSIKEDYLVCLEDGGKVKMLKRYLRSRFDLSPEEYRTKWGLPRTYPMVAPGYAEQRRSLAKVIGLGRKKAVVEETAPAPEPAPAKGPARAGRKVKAPAAPEAVAPVVKRGRKPKAAPVEG